MVKIFNLFRGGYRRGYDDGRMFARHRADWELIFTQPLTWLPGVDQDSYLEGYQRGYRDSMAAGHFLERMQR